MQDLFNQKHIEETATILQQNVAKYFNGQTKIKSTRPFHENFKMALLNEIDLFNYCCRNDSVLLAESSFSFTPEEYKEAFKNSNYVSYCFEKKNSSITYPFYKITAPQLMEKMNSLRLFAQENVAAREAADDQFQPIMDIGQLNDDKYNFKTIRDGKEINFLLGTRNRSSILFHKYPGYFPIMQRNDLMSLFVLSAGATGNLRPEHCEFVKYNGNGNWVTPDENYPYQLYTWYATKIYKAILDALKGREIYERTEKCGFVSVEAFLKLVYEENKVLLDSFSSRDRDRQLNTFRYNAK